MYDADWRLLHVNARAAEWLWSQGREPELLLGRCLWDEFPDLRRAASRDAVLRAVRDGREAVIDASVAGRDYETRIVPHAGGVLGLSRDVTEVMEVRRELERVNRRLERAVRALEARTAEAESARAAAESANQAKSQFLGVMSHELRTPLNSVMGYAELLLMETKGPLREGQREQVGRIQMSAHHQLALVEELLTYARVDAGREVLHIMPVDVGRALRDTVEFMRPQAERRGLALELQLPVEERSLVIVTDPGKLRQVLLNLAGNAVKFTEGGAVALAATGEGDGVVIRVTDTGPGIPDDRRSAIWDPFTQLDSTRSRESTGAGLGLAIVRHLVELMGGTVQLESEIGCGSTFTVRLPRRAPAGSPPRDEPRPPDSGTTQD
jgi:signal transduction histidine kinase